MKTSALSLVCLLAAGLLLVNRVESAEEAGTAKPKCSGSWFGGSCQIDGGESITELDTLISQKQQELDALKVQRKRALEQIQPDTGGSGAATGLDFPGAKTLDDDETVPYSEYEDRPDMLLPRTWFEVGSSVSALATVPFQRGGESFYVIGDVNGMLNFFKYPSKLLMQYDTKHTSPIVAIEFGRREDTFMITAAEDGSVHFHNMSLPKPPRQGNGKRREQTNLGAGVWTTLEVSCYLEWSQASLSEPNAASSAVATRGKSSVTALQMYRRMRHEMLVVGFADGTIRVFYSNGTEHARTTSPAPIRTMLSSGAQYLGQYVAIGVGAGVVFFDLKTMKILPSQCDNIKDDEVVTSLQYDTVHQGVLYAGTEKGNVLVARVQADRKTLSCKVLRRIPDSRPKRRPSPKKNLTEDAVGPEEEPEPVGVTTIESGGGLLRIVATKVH
jgi:hypothetical protein